MKELFNYLNGTGGLLILGFVVLIVFLIKKVRNERYYKQMEKKRKEKDAKRNEQFSK